MHARKNISLSGGLILICCALTGALSATDKTATAAKTINTLGIDLLPHVAKSNENALLSPYSIQIALAMTYAGASGKTKAEMAKVLHYPADEAKLQQSLLDLRKALDEIQQTPLNGAKDSTTRHDPSEPVTLEIANRLYGQTGYAFRPAFLSLVKDNYAAPFQPVDFQNASERVRNEINSWVSDQTHQRINDLIPPGGVNEATRLALVNAIYFKAAWAEEFSRNSTKAEPFFVGGVKSEMVQTMQQKSQRMGYFRGKGFRAITVRYVGGAIQLLILLPDEKTGLAALESKLTPQLLTECALSDPAEVILHLPKFKLEPGLIPLGALLQSLGMKSAFNQPYGSANFDRMAPKKPDDYLFLSEVFHKTFIELDEQGTEAAAATAVTLAAFSVRKEAPRPKPIEIKVDHPFFFAIQHRASGACLFLGRVVDPR